MDRRHCLFDFSVKCLKKTDRGFFHLFLSPVRVIKRRVSRDRRRRLKKPFCLLYS
jgi:hypothetical protein